jgi:hypothetical protein
MAVLASHIEISAAAVSMAVPTIVLTWAIFSVKQWQKRLISTKEVFD